jgi:hypothetical protein
MKMRKNFKQDMLNVEMNYCIHHGFTPFYKNGKCKECVKYQRIYTRMQNRINNSSLNLGSPLIGR